MVVAAFFYLNVKLPVHVGEAQLIISSENGENKKFAGPVAVDMTILEALYSSSLGGGFELRYSMREDGGVALAKIDGLIEQMGKTWHFYLNKKLVNTADIDKTKIRAGDLIEAKYE